MKRQAQIVGSILLLVCVGAGPARALSVSGRVVDSRARSVAGAEVAVYETYDIARDSHGRLIGPVVKTDERGEFSLEAKATSQYGTFIVARKEGLALAWDGLNYGGNTLGKGHFLLVLEEPCTLTGVVVDAGGKPSAGARVQAVPKTSYMSRLYQRPIHAPAEWFTTRTDEQGVFRFDAFAGDVNCDFRVEAPGCNCTYVFTTHYQNSCGFEVGRPDIRLALPAEHRVQGRVVEEGTERGVAGVKLAIRAERETEDILNRYLVTTVVTGDDGMFTCPGLPVGKNRIEPAVAENETPAWVAEPVVVEVAAGQAIQDVRVVLSKGGLIEANVREQATEKPVGGIRVSVYSEHGYANSMTDEAGRVTLRALPGEYSLYASGEMYASWHVSEPTVIKAGETTHVDIALDRAPTIQGRVTDPNGSPVEDILVTAHPFGDHAYTQADGGFTAKYDQQRADRGLCVIARDRARSLVGVVHATQLKEPIELSLHPSLTVTGKVTDPNGRGIPAARASLCVHLWNCLSEMGEEVLTDAEGRFEFRAVPPAKDPLDYRISVHAAGYAPRTYKRIAFEGQPGSTADAGAIELPPADQSVSGVVVDANGAPVPRVILFLSGDGGSEQPRKSTATDEQGRFRFTRISKGAIRVQVNFSNSPVGSGNLRAEAGDQDLKAVLGQDVVHQRFASLTGKALPDLSDLGIPPDAASTEGKAVLLFFWDMQQRPSRSILMQLAKQAEAMKDKQIVALTVDVSGAGRESLDAWMKQSNVPFAAGVLKGPFQEKRMPWGVQSLPWLILTDRNHIVVAEGFAASDVYARLSETGSEIDAADDPNGVVITVVDQQGRALAGVPVTEFQTGRQYVTDVDGQFVCEPSDQVRYFYAVDGQRRLAESERLEPGRRELSMKLAPAQMVSGRVTDPNGRPVAGAQVAALPMTSFYMLTNNQGEFNVGWQPSWEAPGGLCLMARHVERHLGVMVDISSQAARVEIQLAPALSLCGTVTGAEGSPIPGATVSLSLKKWNWACGTPVNRVATDDAGRFMIPALPQLQEYRLYVSAADHLPIRISPGVINTVKGREDLGPIVLAKPASAATNERGRLRLRVVDEDLRPVDVASAQLWKRQPDGGARAEEVLLVSGATPGLYETESLPIGKHHALSINVQGFAPFRLFDVEVPKEPADTIVCRLSRGGTIEGIVTDEAGKPVEGLPVVVNSTLCRRDVVTDPNGRFIASHLPDTRYSVIVEPKSESPYETAVLRGGASCDARDLRITVKYKTEVKGSISLPGLSIWQLEGVSLPLEQSKCRDKAILLCLFDMNQRPSRNCLRQLAAKAAKLEEAGIAVAAVQVTSMDPDALNRWGKENGCSFPLGVLPHKKDNVFAAPPTESLPWLILTDDKHVVVAEGLSVQDLDSRLNQMKN